MVIFGAGQQMSDGRRYQTSGVARDIAQVLGQRLSPDLPDRGKKPPHGGILPRHPQSLSMVCRKAKLV